MVLSTTKMTSRIQSIINANQGGGNKKAGLPPVVGVDTASHNAYTERGDGNLYLMNLRQNRIGKVNMNLPIGMDTRIKMR
jgi:hypothetical protein